MVDTQSWLWHTRLGKKQIPIFEALDGGMVILFGPEYAVTIANDGYTTDDVKHFIFEHAKTSQEKIILSG